MCLSLSNIDVFTLFLSQRLHFVIVVVVFVVLPINIYKSINVDVNDHLNWR